MRRATIISLVPSFIITLLLWRVSIVTSQQIPDSQSLIVDELEHLLVDNGGKNDAAFYVGITPCSAYFDPAHFRFGANTYGRQTAAEWIRVAFRKFYLRYSQTYLLCLACYSLYCKAVVPAPRPD